MKKVMKKLAAFSLLAAMCVAMVACGKPSLKDYLNDEEFQKQFETMKEQVSGMGMDINMEVDGDKLIYTYKYDSIEKSDELAASLESETAKQDATFQETADGLKEEVSNKSVTVVIKYVDKNDAEIYSKEYVAK